MLELGYLSLPYKILKDIISFFYKKKRNLSSAEIVQLRNKWQPIFEDKINQRRREGLREDVIIRDMKRVDHYPDAEPPKKGISPWFRVGLVGTYHRGILVGLRWETLNYNKKSGEWKKPNYKSGERGTEKVVLIGYIPFENIESFNWEGDNIYGFPHLYCYFGSKDKEPYEKLSYCKKQFLDEFPFYTELIEYKKVKQT